MIKGMDLESIYGANKKECIMDIGKMEKWMVEVSMWNKIWKEWDIGNKEVELGGSRILKIWVSA